MDIDVIMLIRALLFIPIGIYIFIFVYDILKRLKKRELASGMLFLRYEKVIKFAKYSVMAASMGVIAAYAMYLYEIGGNEAFRVVGSALEVVSLTLFSYTIRLLDLALGG